MLVNHNPYTYALVVVGKYFVGYIGLACFVYFLLALFIAGVPGIKHPVSIFIEAVGALEILWYLFWFLPFKAYLQRPGPAMAPMNKTQRRSLMMQALDHIPDFRLFVRKWFANAHLDDIYREDIRKWLTWALFASNRPGDVDPEELDEYLDEAETRAGMKFPKGTAAAQPIRLNLDPVAMYHKSLTMYGIIFLIDTAATLYYLVSGFKYYRQPRSSFFKIFPLRPMNLLSLNESAGPEFSYWYRPHKSKSHRPIVFFHGIGVGLATYMFWVQTIPKDIGVLLVEIMPVSNRICPPAVSNTAYVVAMRKILKQQKIDDFVFVGHSYGTFLARPLLDDPIIRPKINSLVLVDPVAILLHLPEVAYNITRRKPKTAPQIEIDFAAAKDPLVAHTVCRRFHWPQHILWRENLVGKRTTAVVSSRDCVIHPDAVASYVYYGDTNYSVNDVEEWKKTPEAWTGRGEIELYYMYGRDHGQPLLIREDMKKMTKLIETYARINMGPDPRAAAEQEVKGSPPGQQQVSHDDSRPVPFAELDVPGEAV